MERPYFKKCRIFYVLLKYVTSKEKLCVCYLCESVFEYLRNLHTVKIQGYLIYYSNCFTWEEKCLLMLTLEIF